MSSLTAAASLNLESSSDEKGQRGRKRSEASKYDFVKVKVWLGENMDNYYVLSRFLIRRMLTVTKIPYAKAVKISLEVKKYLVDNNLLDVTQEDLEELLFSIIRSKHLDEGYIRCYKMVTQFFQMRQPLVIVLCGTAWTGKSTIAQELATRINIPNVMQTDVTYELLRSGDDPPLPTEPLWCRHQEPNEVIQQFRRECRIIRKGLDGDLTKTLSDGKPLIIEGLHLDPGLFIEDFARLGRLMLPGSLDAVIASDAEGTCHDSKPDSHEMSQTQPESHVPFSTNGRSRNANHAALMELCTSRYTKGSLPEREQNSQNFSSGATSGGHYLKTIFEDSNGQEDKFAGNSKSEQPKIPTEHVEEDDGVDPNPRSKLKPLFVPVLLYMDEVEHELVAEEARGPSDQIYDAGVSFESAALKITSMRIVQDYLHEFRAQGLPAIQVRYGNFSKPLDQLHRYVLHCIQLMMQTSTTCI